MSDFKRLAEIQGRALADGLEANIATCIETSGSYTAYGSTLTLTASNLELALIKFNTQTTTDAEGRTIKLGLVADTLLVPPDLEMAAQRILNSTLIPGSANNDVNVLKGRLSIVVSRRLSSASVWYLMASKSPVGLIYQKVVGPPPETHVQDIQSTQVSDIAFRYDKISFRADMIYGLKVLDAKTILRSTS